MDIYDDMADWFTGLHEHIFSTPELAPLQQLFPLTTKHMSDPRFAARVHVSAVKTLGDSLSGAGQSLMIQAIDGYLRQKRFLPSVGASDGVEHARRWGARALSMASAAVTDRLEGLDGDPKDSEASESGAPGLNEGTQPSEGGRGP